MTAATATASAEPAPVGFGATLASELTKLTAMRSTRITLVVAVLLSTALSALVCIVIGATWDDAKPEDKAAFNPVDDTLAGTLVVAILFAVLGVRAVAGEYASGMMRLTLTVTPRRGRVLAAKAAIVTAITLVVGAIATAAMLLTGQVIFSSFGLETADFGSSRAWETILAILALGPLFPVIGVALATMLRSTAGAITAILALIFLPAILGPLMPAFVEEEVFIYLPGAASDAISPGTEGESAHQLSAAAAIPVLAGWIAVFLGAAYALLTKRDA
jgi:ABC-2 type transport system permease protein